MKTPPDPVWSTRSLLCVLLRFVSSFYSFYFPLDLILFILVSFCFGCYIYTHISRTFLFSSKKDNISRIARYKNTTSSWYGLSVVFLASFRYVFFVFFFFSVGVEFVYFFVSFRFSAWNGCQLRPTIHDTPIKHHPTAISFPTPRLNTLHLRSTMPCAAHFTWSPAACVSPGTRREHCTPHPTPTQPASGRTVTNVPGALTVACLFFSGGKKTTKGRIVVG